MNLVNRALTVLVLLASLAVVPTAAQQGTGGGPGGVTVTGAVTAGHCVQFVTATTIQDSGGVCGGGGGTPASPLTSVQFHDTGDVFGGSANLTWDNTLNVLGIITTGSTTPTSISTTTTATQSNSAVRSIDVFADTSGNNHTSSLIGVNVQNEHDSSGTLGLSYAIRAPDFITSGGAVSVIAGINIGNQGGVASILAAALLIDDQGTGANDYAIKIDGGKSDLGPQSTKVGSLLTTTNCAAVGSGADPSVAACTAAAAGMVSCATSLTNTCTITTSAITTKSEIFILQNTSANAAIQIGGGITCNVTPSVLAPLITSQGTGTVTFSVTKPSVNPNCYNYFVVN